MSSPSISALTAGNCLERVDARLDEERHEAELDAVLLLERVLVARRAAPSPPDMSTSLKVVSMAAVCCASTRRAAMVAAQARHASRAPHAGHRARGAGLAAGDGRGRRAAGRARYAEHVGSLVDAAVLAGAWRRSAAASGAGPRPSAWRRRAKSAACAPARRPGADWPARVTGPGAPRRRAHAGRSDRRAGSSPWGMAAAPSAGADAPASGGDQADAPTRADLTAPSGRRRSSFQHAGGRRGDLDRDLVGLEFHQGLVGGHRVAGSCLEPARRRWRR